jgi:hypothetical protein
VHALRHVHELVVPGGTVVDLHPVTEGRVEAGGRALGVIPEPEWASGDLPNAEARLHDAIRDGLLVLEAEAEFDVLQHFDDAEELVEVKQEHLVAVPNLERRIRAATPPLVVREHAVLRRLRVR